jgi:RES domain-containing protein
MTMNHPAIYRAYPQVVAIYEDRGAFDRDNNPVQLDQAKVDKAAVIVTQEQAYESARQSRASAYTTEADPLFFKVQRGEADQADYDAKIAEIRTRYPYPSEAE